MGRYDEIDKKKSYNETRGRQLVSQKTSYYPAVAASDSDMYFITQYGDKLDVLADRFYGDPNLWWYIARINNLNSMNLEPGVYIRIPMNADVTRGQ